MGTTMFKAILLLSLMALVVILGLSILALYIETLVFDGWDGIQNQLTFPEALLPIQIVKMRGFSLGLIVAAGGGVWLTGIFYERLFVKRWGWVSQADFNKLFGKK